MLRVPTHSEPAPEVYRGLVDVVPDAVVAVAAATGLIRWVNAQAEAMFGRPREELLGRPLDVLLPERFRDVHLREHLDLAGRPGGSAIRARLDVSAVGHDGAEFPVEMILAPLETGRERLVAVALRDASERATIREASERLRDELIATVSHELRTPLTSILGYTEILVDMGEEAISEQAAALLAIVQRNAERELRLVEDLLTLAVMRTDPLVLEPRPTDLGEVLASVLEGLAPQAASAGVALSRTGPATLWVVGDAARLAQVLTNLLLNAIKFTPEGGRIEVRLRVEGAHAVLEVEDQGHGVHAEELPQVFDRLYRAPRVVAAQVPGAGLGLPIVKGIVDAHLGAVDVASEPGEGTTVQVRLPLATAQLAG